MRFDVKVDTSLKILSFLSFHTYHKITNRTILHRIRPYPAKGALLQASGSFARALGEH